MRQLRVRSTGLGMTGADHISSPRIRHGPRSVAGSCRWIELVLYRTGAVPLK